MERVRWVWRAEGNRQYKQYFVLAVIRLPRRHLRASRSTAARLSGCFKPGKPHPTPMGCGVSAPAEASSPAKPLAQWGAQVSALRASAAVAQWSEPGLQVQDVQDVLASFAQAVEAWLRGLPSPLNQYADKLLPATGGLACAWDAKVRTLLRAAACLGQLSMPHGTLLRQD
jgi:hypothetical protein